MAAILVLGEPFFGAAGINWAGDNFLTTEFAPTTFSAAVIALLVEEMTRLVFCLLEPNFRNGLTVNELPRPVVLPWRADFSVPLALEFD